MLEHASSAQYGINSTRVECGQNNWRLEQMSPVGEHVITGSADVASVAALFSRSKSESNLEMSKERVVVRNQGMLVLQVARNTYDSVTLHSCR
jgi:hypothetical protein